MQRPQLYLAHCTVRTPAGNLCAAANARSMRQAGELIPGSRTDVWGGVDQPYLRDDAREVLASLARHYRVFVESNQLVNFSRPLKSTEEVDVYRQIELERSAAVAEPSPSISEEDPDRTLVGESPEKVGAGDGSLWKELAKRLGGTGSLHKVLADSGPGLQQKEGGRGGGGIGVTASSAILISSDDAEFA